MVSAHFTKGESNTETIIKFTASNGVYSIKIYSHDNLSLHRPLPYFSYGKMHEPLEVPERMTELLKAPAALGLTVTTAKDIGMAPILAVHDSG